MTVGYDEFVGKLNISEETTMKSLFKQLGGTYSKQSDYLIPNVTFPKSEKTLLVFMDSDTCNTYKSTAG